MATVRRPTHLYVCDCRCQLDDSNDKAMDAMNTATDECRHNNADGKRRRPTGVRVARRGQRAPTSRAQTDHTTTTWTYTMSCVCANREQISTDGERRGTEQGRTHTDQTEQTANSRGKQHAGCFQVPIYYIPITFNILDLLSHSCSASLTHTSLNQTE